MNDKILQQVFINMNKKPTEELSRIVQENNKELYTEEAFQVIKQILANRNNKVSKPEKQEDIESLIDTIISEENYYTNNEQEKAISILKQKKPVEATEQLIEILKDDRISFSVRINTIKAIGIIGLPLAIEQLSIELDSPIDDISEQAYDALEMINDPLAQSSIQRIPCEACTKNFYQGINKKSLCPVCRELDKIEGWLLVFAFSIIIGVIVSFGRCAYLMLGYTSNAEIGVWTLLLDGFLGLGVFFILISKKPIARSIIILVLILNIFFLLLNFFSHLWGSFVSGSLYGLFISFVQIE